jgi:hypothetical protein
MCGQIEQSADAISDGTTDANTKMAALKWKMDAVPAMREALFRPDPYTATVDTAVLCCQMTNYFDTGPGKQALGDMSAQAAASCRSMTDEYFQVIASATYSGDVSRARAFAEKWAADHPITYAIAGRASALARVNEDEFIGPHTAIEYVADTAVTADDLSRKIDIYSDQLFREVQWQIELMRLEMARDYHVDQAFPLAERAVTSAERATATVDRLDPALERSLAIAEDAPKLVASERQAAMDAMHQELDGQRVAALKQADGERVIAMEELHQALLDQAKQLTTDAEQITARKIDEVMDRATRLVGFSLAAVFIAAVVGLLFVRRMLVRSQRQRGAQVST